SPDELKAMLEPAVGLDVPAAIRYPKGSTSFGKAPSPLALGKAELFKKGEGVAIISVGSMAETAMRAAAALESRKINAMVINARFIKPLDEEFFERIFEDIKNIVTLEDGVIEGGFGSAVLEFIERRRIRGVRVKILGLPNKFIEHGSRQELFSKYNLTPDAVCDVIVKEVS
ncbi:MAG: 1-deoxy-D-xylulose-5-phosphate synthase, partial [Candidatus Omnitrophica bacterium]|nr:1-deoxy-D-xylulose-5-phosphate synthase [Candidatus Omnitrophota bacterium]